MNEKLDSCTCPSGDGSLRHPCPAHPATIATVKHGGCVQLGDPRSHRWDDVGERCLDCGDKDWMGGACSGPRATAVAGPWLSITNAPNDGQQHIRGLWVTSRIDGKPDTREWRQYIGLVNDGGEFVDPEYGETFGWEADEYEAWMPAPEAPGAALSAQPSPGGQGALVDTARRNIRQFISRASFSSSVDKQAALSCVDVLEQAALAARQPGAQVPPFSHDTICGLQYGIEQLRDIERGQWKAKDWDSSDNYVTANIGHAKKVAAHILPHLTEAVCAMGDMWYVHNAAPPAQAVDLGKYRHALLRASGWARRSDVTSHAEDAGLLRELLALIDSQS